MSPLIFCLTSRANDSALLTHKQSLPVRSLVLADMHRPEAESAAYRLGDLRCHGDSESRQELNG